MSVSKDTEKYVANFGKFLKTHREIKGFSAYAVAQKAGVTDNAVRFCEQGKTLPSLELVTKIALGLELSPSELLQEYEKTLAPHSETM